MATTSDNRSGPALTVRMLDTNTEISALVALFDEIWRPDPGNRPVSADMLRALIHSGNYVSGAYLGDVLVGGAVGFFAAPRQCSGKPLNALHSHIAGVSRAGRGLNVGHELKLHQRQWGIERGVDEITWTFDPLVARNAYFNLAKLGATAQSYHLDFYGDIGDEIGGADPSDRLLVSWRLRRTDAPPAVDASALREAGAHWAIDTTDPDDPKPVPLDLASAETVLVPVPGDIETMRLENPAAASRWRLATRRVLVDLLADGGRRAAFDRSGCYVFTPVAMKMTESR